MKGPIGRILSDMTDQEIKVAVAERYGQVACTPDAKFNFPLGRKFAESVGYETDEVWELSAAVGKYNYAARVWVSSTKVSRSRALWRRIERISLASPPRTN